MAVGGEDLRAVTGAGPDVAFAVAADAVGAALVDFGEDVAACQGSAVGGDVEDADVAWGAGVGDVELGFVFREAEAVWFVEVFGDGLELLRLGVVAVDVVAGLDFLTLAEAIVGIGKPEGAVGLDDDVVGGVEVFAFELFDDGFDFAVG